jgi:hypothetical protein
MSPKEGMERMNGSAGLFREEVTISVERMMRYCVLAKLQSEHLSHDTRILPVHLTRFGTLLIETSSFLYSLFDERDDSIDLTKVWQGFEHPFGDDLQKMVTRLSPFKPELKLVRHRLGFHGTLSRERERAGLGIFDVNSGKAREFARLTIDFQQLFLRMIAWYIKQMDCTMHPTELWEEFVGELRGSESPEGQD